MEKKLFELSISKGSCSWVVPYIVPGEEFLKGLSWDMSGRLETADNLAL